MNFAASTAAVTSARSINLADVELAVRGVHGLTEKQRRDYRSAVVRIAKICGDDPSNVPLDFEVIRAKLGPVSPVGIGISPKTYANIRSNFIRAVRASGLKAIHLGGRGVRPKSLEWSAFRKHLKDRRTLFGLSLFMYYCDRNGISPEAVTENVIAEFVIELRSSSLRQRPDKLHRTTATIWNEVADRSPNLKLIRLAVPSSWTRHRRLDWSSFPRSFVQDVEQCQSWFGHAERFSRHARPKALGPNTLITQRGYIHGMATSAVESGIPPRAVRKIKDLVAPDNFERILQHRDGVSRDADNAYNYFAAQCLYRIAKEWIKPSKKILEEIRWLANQVPHPKGGMTEKNRAILRKFDDPAALRRLYALPGRLFSEVRRQQCPNMHSLTRVHMALAIAILSYLPIRLANLLALEFDKHLLIRTGPRQKSFLCLSAKETKNQYDVEFELPEHIAKLLAEYRDRLAPRLYGHKVKHLFLSLEGSIKRKRGFGDQITAYLHRYVGIKMNPHAFRHLAGEIVLRTFPQGHVIVKDLLGHKSISTTLAHYVHMDSRRAGLLHQQALLNALPADLRERIAYSKRSNTPAGLFV